MWCFSHKALNYFSISDIIQKVFPVELYLPSAWKSTPGSQMLLRCWLLIVILNLLSDTNTEMMLEYSPWLMGGHYSYNVTLGWEDIDCYAVVRSLWMTKNPNSHSMQRGRIRLNFFRCDIFGGEWLYWVTLVTTWKRKMIAFSFLLHILIRPIQVGLKSLYWHF